MRIFYFLSVRIIFPAILMIALASQLFGQMKEELKTFGSISQYEQAGKPSSMHPRSLPQKPPRSILNAFDDRNLVEVKFLDEIEIEITPEGRPADKYGNNLISSSAVSLMNSISASGGIWRRLTSGMEAEIEILRSSAQQNLNRSIANLNNYFMLSVPAGQSAEEWIDRLNLLSEVEIAEPRHTPPPLPVPNYQSNQGYLNAATTGVDASYAWSLSDSGQGVNICDFEYAWNLNHRDLPAGIAKLLPPGYYEVAMTASDTNHGTAVLGELASRNNGWGTKGIAYGASIKVAPTWMMGPSYPFPTWYLDVSMMNAMTSLNRGDIFLIEQQEIDPYFNGTDSGLVPVEWDGTIYNIILTAVGNGFHIVEAGANGYRNLDSAIYNVNHAPFLPQNNSGAIIVGAGSAPPSFGGTDVARARLSYSNYGSRLNLQGWGDTVYTTGYGTLYGAGDSAYTGYFAGTSSASPIVAGAVALVESRFESSYGKEIAPLTMRTMLATTGSPQQSGFFPSTQKIGPLPNVRAAIDSFFSPTMTLSGTYTVGLGANYQDLTAVSNALRQKVVTGNVIFEIQSTYQSMTESLPISFSEFTTRGGNWSVVIRPASGVTGVLTYGRPPAHPYTTYPVIKLDGVDRLTLDGRPGGAGTSIGWTIRNTRTDSVGATIQFENDATFNTATYLQVEGQNPTSYPGTVYFGGYTGLQGNSHNVVSNCDIRDRSDLFGVPSVAVYSDWTLSAPNDSNTIEGNNIYNWSGYGIYFYGERWVIKGNSFFEQTPQNTQLTGIFMNGGNGHLIQDNWIGGGLSKNGGAPLQVVSPTMFTGIWLAVDTLQATSIQGNRISNIHMVNASGASFYGISVFQGNADIGTLKRNIIGDSSLNGSISIWGTGGVGGISMNLMMRNLVNIENNLIANIDQVNVVPGELRAINIIGMRECRVVNNEIRNIGPSLPMAKNVVRAIYLQGTNDSVLVANNMISLGHPVANDCQYEGIYTPGSWPMLIKIYFNSIYIGGTAGGPSNTYCLNDAGLTPMIVKDNIFYNARSGGVGFNYAIVASSKPWMPPTFSDYNVLFNLNPATLTQQLGMNLNFSAWQMATSGDANSVSADPKFTSPSSGDLHLNPGIYSPADNAGVPLPGIASDFDGESRGGNPDIGADEYLINSPSSFSLQSPADGDTNQPCTGTLRWVSSPAAGRYDLYLDTLAPPTTKVAPDITDTLYNYSAIDTNKTYYWYVVAKNSSGQKSSNNAPWRFFTGAGSGGVTQYFSILQGWNMLSVPLLVSDRRKETLYPTAISNAFGYDGSYTLADTLEYGTGYWVKFDSAESVSFSGFTFGVDTIGVIDKWNMIGCTSDQIPVDSISSEPGGIITSNFFGFDGSAYKKVDTLKPGYGYWVKVNQAGNLVLQSGSSLPAGSRIRIWPISEMPPSPPDRESAGAVPVMPERFALGQNYPNPFNPVTSIGYHLPIDGPVSIRLYTLLGQEIITLVDRFEKAGIHQIEFDGSHLTSGIYYYRMTAGGFIETKKLILMK